MRASPILQANSETMADIVCFEGREWIDAQVEYFKLHPSLQIKDNKWDRRLKALGIKNVLPDARTTERGNISKLMHEGRSLKSQFVAKEIWDMAIKSATDFLTNKQLPIPIKSVESEFDHDGGEDNTEGKGHISCEEEDAPLQQVSQIVLEDAEKLHHEGQDLEIRAFGERSVDGIFLDARDVCNAIGTRLDNMPSSVSVDTVSVHGTPTQVLSWDNFCTLAVLKAHGHPVAAAIKRWIVATVFAVQYKAGVGASQQAVFASRETRFSVATYTGGLTGDDLVVYLFDAFPAQALIDKYPGTFPEMIGGNISISRVLKLGIGKRERIQATRCDLNKILPGHDPRPIIIQKVRGVTNKEELKTRFEDVLFEEFGDYRIGHDGRLPILGPRNSNYTEMLVADPDIKEQIVRQIMSMVDNHHEKLEEQARRDLTAAHADSHEVMDLKMQLKLKVADKRASDVELKSVQQQLQSAQDQLQTAHGEIIALKTTLKNLLPKKTAAKFAALFCV